MQACDLLQIYYVKKWAAQEFKGDLALNNYFATWKKYFDSIHKKLQSHLFINVHILWNDTFQNQHYDITGS